jgi:transcriptional regulator of aromatic amino acid metabolism
VLQILIKYNWPGNIRQFKSAMEENIVPCLALPLMYLPNSIAVPVGTILS